MNRIIGVLLMSLVLNACEFHQSVNKDLSTGAYLRGDGLGCDDVTIEINGKVDNRSTFTYGEKVNFVFNDVSGFTRENGSVYPGLSMYIVKNEEDTVLSYPNLLDDLNEGTDLPSLQLHANFVIALPFRNDEKYKVCIKIWDKKGDGSLTYELPFNVEENKLLQITSNDLTYSNIYLWDETAKQIVIDNNVNVENTLILILEGLDGMEVIDNKVYPSFSIKITDNQGNEILSSSNILSEYENSGIDYEAFKASQLPVTITFPSSEINNPCRLEASLTDGGSDKHIDITTQLEIK